MKRYRRDPWAVSRPRPQGQVVIPLGRLEGQLEGNVLLLDDVAGRIWELLRSPRSTAELQEALLREYEVSAEQIEADLERFLKELEELQAIIQED